MRSRTIGIIIGIIGLLVVVAAGVWVFGSVAGLGFLGHGLVGRGMMYYGYGRFGYYPGVALLRFVFMVLILGGAAALVVWLFRRGAPAHLVTSSTGGQAVTILRERYAKGEITHEEYDQIRKDLEEK